MTAPTRFPKRLPPPVRVCDARRYNRSGIPTTPPERMAIKKSDLYSTLWASCDELRGGMEPPEYKDYVLFMLFIKYVSDKYAGDEDALLVIPKGASFTDMVKLKGNGDIGNLINTQVIQPLIDANPSSLARTDFPNFAAKLGKPAKIKLAA